ncbi:MAG: hypothetical protein IH607_07275 [Firmicutes bacterium]|nr:hypothetical protein [Bacillota bacterium]
MHYHLPINITNSTFASDDANYRNRLIGLLLATYNFYIIDQYGLDTVLDYIRLGQTEQQAFGKTFIMLTKEWDMALLRKSGGV